MKPVLLLLIGLSLLALIGCTDKQIEEYECSMGEKTIDVGRFWQIHSCTTEERVMSISEEVTLNPYQAKNVYDIVFDNQYLETPKGCVYQEFVITDIQNFSANGPVFLEEQDAMFWGPSSIPMKYFTIISQDTERIDTQVTFDVTYKIRREIWDSRISSTSGCVAEIRQIGGEII